MDETSIFCSVPRGTCALRITAIRREFSRNSHRRQSRWRSLRELRPRRRFACHDSFVPTVLEKDVSRGAQRALNYLGVLGTAVLVTLDGDILLSSGKKDRDWLAPIAKSVAACARAIEPSSPNRIASLDAHECCTYFARVGAFEAILVIMEARIAPALAVERFSRVLAVFDKVIGAPFTPSPGGSGGPPGGAAAVASVDVAKAWDRWAKRGPKGPIEDDTEIPI